ncbi:S1C family serine protease [Caldalkalibacillus salinus]|uniref:S1C family serine protease n=1 Tax=Caldalkalibacillus salinus TaxID=2803787 RepID=UPI0019245156|nr:trypsin-like peptidase domain-containing protein [Caldalkalibacillus salinus]
MSRDKQSKWSMVFTSLTAGVIGSMLTFGVVTQGGYLSEGENSSAQSVQEESAGTEQEASTSQVDVEQVSASSESQADMIEQTSQAIVGVTHVAQQQHPFNRRGEEAQNGTGSGVIYEVTDDAAYIVTNNHVVEGANEIEVSLYNGEVVTADVVGSDPLTDIAVLKIEGNYSVEPLAFGDSESLRTGEKVLAIGNPLGLNLSRTVTQGIVSAVDRTISVPTSAGEWELEVIQTDAAINPGNSGGALINAAGELVGINSLKIANNGVEGLGFAIPSDDVAKIVKELTNKGYVERPYLGVGLASLSDIPSYYLQDVPSDVTEGAIVVSVDPSSAAAEAGLQPEDILVSIDDHAIQNDNSLRKYLYTGLSVGDTVTLEFYREGELQTVNVTLDSNEQTQQ